jgi:hypothetical protein
VRSQEQVRGELNTLESALDACCQLLDGGGFCQTWCPLYQQVTIRQQGDEQALDQGALADDAGVEVVAQV